jgi:hypothetical protein
MAEKSIKKKIPSYYSESYKRRACEEYLNGELTKKEIWYKYTGQKVEHGGLLRWLRKYGYVEKFELSKGNYTNFESMKQKESEENIRLKNEIENLKEQLLDAKVQKESYLRMLEIAEEKYKLSIRKKPNTK